MSLENIQTEIAALRNDVKNLTKLVRKIKNTQEDPDGELISRSEVTKFINKYITEKGLKHPENGRQIILDDKLRELLSPPEGVVVTYLNLQKYLSPHYVKKA